MRRIAECMMCLSLALVLGCADSDSSDGVAGGDSLNPIALPSLVLAETRQGTIHFSDVDRYLLALPPGQRFDTKSDRSERYAGIARRIAVDQLLLEEATLVGADQDPEFLALQRRIERNASSDHFLGALPPDEALTETNLREAFDLNIDRFQHPEKRKVSHIYKRFDLTMTRERAETELTEIRERLLAGESFDLLAREHSDSETRHDGGLLGQLERGQFTKDFDRVVFALEEGQPSETLVTADGAHLFLVQEILEERSLEFEEVRSSLRRELETKRQTQILRDAASALPLPEPNFVPGPDEVLQLLRLGDRGTVLLRLGDFTLSVSQFQEILQNRRRLLAAKHVPDLPFLLLDEIRFREIIFQYQIAEGLENPSRDQFELARERELIEHFARRKMSARVERQAELIQHHYDNNRMRFASPLKVHLKILSIPLGKNDASVMGELEAARADLDAGLRTIEDLAESFHGQVKDLGFASAVQIQAVAPRSLRFVFLLEPGGHAPPHVMGASMVMFQSVARQEPKARPLALVRDEVMSDYLAHHAADVFAQLADEMLEQAEFRLNVEGIAGLQ